MIFADSVPMNWLPSLPYYVDKLKKGVNPWALREHGMQTLPPDSEAVEHPIESVEKVLNVFGLTLETAAEKPDNVDGAVLVSGIVDP